jgi:hypothetical protein
MNKLAKLSGIVFHPFTFAVYPCLVLLAHNIKFIAAPEATRSLVYSLFASLLLFLVLRWITRSWSKSGLMTTAILILFFSYGHIYAVTKKWTIGDFVIGRHRYLLPLWLVLLVLVVWFVWRSRSDFHGATQWLNLVGVVSLIFPLYTIVAFMTRTEAVASVDSNVVSMDEFDRTNPPDIYYIILDGYARADVLEERYGIDNRSFLEFLESRGFVVADWSRSNYTQTVLSLSSTLNMAYIQDFDTELGVVIDDVSQVSDLMEHSRGRRFLESLGYKTVAFGTGYGQTEFYSADYYYTSIDAVMDQNTSWISNQAITSFEGQLIHTTLTRAFLDLQILGQEQLRQKILDPEYLIHRRRILYAFDMIPKIDDMPGQYFVFAHIISPHPPFVFGELGELVEHEHPYALMDANYFSGSREDYITGYHNQLKYINMRVQKMIDELLSNADVPPVIILQADHGPGAYLEWESPEESDLWERTSILNAYYLPGVDQGLLYEDITPVNSFRVVFSQYFGADLALLPDKTYHSTWDYPLDFISLEPDDLR